MNVLFSHQKHPYPPAHYNLVLQLLFFDVFAVECEVNAVISTFEKFEERDFSNEEECFLLLMNHFNTLIGTGTSVLRFSWTEGLLKKLHNLSHLLHEINCNDSSCEDTSNTKELYFKSQFLYRSAKQAAEATDHIPSYTTSGKRQINRIRLKNALFKLKRAVSTVVDITKQLFVTCQSDENLILFILKHREQIDSLYHRDFSQKLIEEMVHPSQSLEVFLKKRYTERNLTHLFPLIDEKIAELKNVSPLS